MKDILYTVFYVLIAMIGYHIHHSIFWSIFDSFFSPLVLLKWIICHEITLTIIKDTFSWFFV